LINLARQLGGSNVSGRRLAVAAFVMRPSASPVEAPVRRGLPTSTTTLPLGRPVSRAACASAMRSRETEGGVVELGDEVLAPIGTASELLLPPPVIGPFRCDDVRSRVPQSNEREVIGGGWPEAHGELARFYPIGTDPEGGPQGKATRCGTSSSTRLPFSPQSPAPQQ
jgi:hypothetical protein